MKGLKAWENVLFEFRSESVKFVVFPRGRRQPIWESKIKLDLFSRKIRFHRSLVAEEAW